MVELLWMLAPPLSNFKMVNVPFLLALGPPGRSHTQLFNSETERVVLNSFFLSYSRIYHTEHCAAWKHLCMVAEIRHVLLLVHS